jgi:MFS family permease
MSTTAVTEPAGPAGLRMSTARGRWVVTATVLGSGLAAVDATVVGIAIPAIGRDFHAGVTSLQWVVDAYTLTLACCCSAGRSATATGGAGCS